MYSKICVIGIGTLGGFLAKNLSELETTNKLLLIDYDTVEQENIRNSVYIKTDIGQPKTKAILDKLNGDVLVHTINDKFIEGKTKIENCDLILDCRDFTYERENLIDVRLSISARNLIVDCRKNVTYQKQHEGKYIIPLTKTEIKVAALNATILIGNGIIRELIKRQVIQNIPIDSISEQAKNFLEQKTEDLIYDEHSFEKKLVNLHNNYSTIMDLNKKNDLTVYIGEKTSHQLAKVIPKNNFNSINDIMSSFSSIINNLPFSYNYYIIYVNNKGRYVEILPETGSA